MPELIRQFSSLTQSNDGTMYVARVYGEQRRDRKWVGWIEFAPLSDKASLRTSGETEQSNRDALGNWAAGLERTESRANIREDYPYTDDIDWLKWLRVKKNGTSVSVWAIDIPIERYPVRPKPERYLHPCLQKACQRGIVREIADAGVMWA
jgi:hypothetical protein